MSIVEPGNVPSQRVVEKCGFAKQNTFWLVNSGDSEEKPFFCYRLYAKAQ